MSIDKLERAVSHVRNKPLLLVCVTSTGKAQSMTIRQCWESGARFLHVDCSELDILLGAELGGDKEF